MTRDPLRRIQPLPPVLASQIAAGEVVERPASVVKELTENALDAGAKLIELTFDQGGVGLVRVEDDGCGIHHDDLRLAVTGQATSKIRDARELESIASLGFRGEALASIGAVSRLVLDSRRTGTDGGWRLRVEGGRAEGPAPVAMRAGTRVEVRDLFFNIPARRKFLRSERTEQAHLLATARRLALSCFAAGFRVVAGRREVLKVPPATGEAEQEARVARVLGSAFMEQARPVAVEHPDLTCHGWLGAPDAARSHTDGQYLYLNGRMVRDRLLIHGIRQAFGDALPPGRQPTFVLYVELDPARVDVNVHPTKHEVRFRDSRLVHDVVAGGLVRSMGDLGGAARTVTMPRALAGSPRVAEGPPAYGPARAHRPEAKTTAAGVLAVVGGCYAITVTGEELVAVDLRRLARRRVERALEGMGAGGGDTRPLLMPRVVRADRAVVRWVERSAAVLEGLGIEAGVAGPHAVTVRRLPACLRDAHVEALLAALAGAALGEGAPGAAWRRIVAESVASAPLDREAAARLMEDADEPLPADCTATLAVRDLARLFGSAD